MTPLRRTVLRWAVMLGGIERRETTVFVVHRGRPCQDVQMRYVVPMGLEPRGPRRDDWRAVESQVAALLKLRLLRRAGRDRVEATEAGVALLG